MSNDHETNLRLDALTADIGQASETLHELRVAMEGFSAGQTRIIEGQATTNRLLEQLVSELFRETDTSSTADLLRALLAATNRNTDILLKLPNAVEARVALHTTGEIISPA